MYEKEKYFTLTANVSNMSLGHKIESKRHVVFLQRPPGHKEAKTSTCTLNIQLILVYSFNKPFFMQTAHVPGVHSAISSVKPSFLKLVSSG